MEEWYVGRLVVIGLLLISVVAPISVAASTPEAAGREPNTVDAIVLFDESSSVNESRIRAVGGTVTGGRNVSVVPVRFVQIPEPATAALKRAPEIVDVTRNHVVQQVGSQMSVASSQTVPWGISRINGQRAGASVNRTAQRNVQVAVIDTGIDPDHEDLASNVVWGVDTLGSGAITTGVNASRDTNDHGTKVAGVIAARDNDQGVIGVAPFVQLYAVESLNLTGTGRINDVIEGIDQALKGPDGEVGTADDADVISMSFGTAGDSSALEQAIEEASDQAVLTAAVGNAGDGDPDTDDVLYPAKYPIVIGVAATNDDNRVPAWSSEGPAVAVAAPGVRIRTTKLDDSYGTTRGTSFATPHVAGTAALMIAKDLADGNRDRTVFQHRRQLLDTAKDIEASGFDHEAGHGLIKADRALGLPTKPAIEIRHPPSGTTVKGDVSIELVATDSQDGPDDLTVEVSLDSGPWRSTSHTSGDQFTLPWETEAFTEGSHQITVRVTNSAGLSARESISVVVNNHNAPPEAELQAPEHNATVRNITAVRVVASDAEDDNASLQSSFAVDGREETLLHYNSRDQVFVGQLDASSFAEGSRHRLTARVEDDDGAVATSSVEFVVDNVDNAPSVRFITPVNGSQIRTGIAVRVSVRDDRTPQSNHSVSMRLGNHSWESLQYDHTAGEFIGRINGSHLVVGPQRLSIRADDGTKLNRTSIEVTASVGVIGVNDNLRLSADHGGTTAGDRIEVRFQLSHEFQTARSLGLELKPLPDRWTIVDQTSEGGVWADQKQTWFWIDSIPPAESRNVTVTLFVPPDIAIGNYSVAAVVSSGDGNRSAVESTIPVRDAQPPLRVLAGADRRFQFDEVIDTIGYFNRGEPVPGSGGAELSFEDVLESIRLFNTNERIAA